MSRRQIFSISGLAVFILILAVSCSNSDTAGPDDNLVDISGITETNDAGVILGGDLSDWCYSTDKILLPVPVEYAFYPAYPNPNFGVVTFAYDLPKHDSVHIYIINSTGEVVAELVNEAEDAGHYEITWNHETDGGHIADGGMFRAVMECTDFECTGDILSERPKMTLYAVPQDDENLTIKYTADQPVAGLFMVLPISGSVYNTNFSIYTNGMDAAYNVLDDSLRILIAVSPTETGYMPATDEQKSVCFIYHDGAISLDSAQASDTLGVFLFDIDIEKPDVTK